MNSAIRGREGSGYGVPDEETAGPSAIVPQDGCSLFTNSVRTLTGSVTKWCHHLAALFAGFKISQPAVGRCIPLSVGQSLN